jgi:nucleolar complex protein 3
MGKKDRRKDGEGGDKKRELPQAAPVDDDDLEPDEDDVAFVNAHRAYGAFFGDRLSVRAIAETDPGSKRRRKRVAEEDKTAEFERGGPREAGAWEGAEKEKRGDDDDAATRTPLALPVKRLDGTVVHQPTAPAPIDGDEVDLASLPAAARAALQKARASWDEDADDAPKRGKKARRELADEMRRTEYGQKSSEKWWDPSRPSPGDKGGTKNENGKDGDDGNDRRDGRTDGGTVDAADSADSESDFSDSDGDAESDVDPATAARRARSAAAAASEAEMSAEDRLLSVKARIGAACQGVLEDPEGRWTELEEVTKLAEDRDPEVARLGALSAALVFKDVCPGYRIRALTPKELAMKVTKETQKLRDFEAGLLRMYKGFVRLVTRRGGGEKKTRAQRGGGLGLAPGVALTCLCQLLAALPHFNFRTDVLSALVPHMARADAAAAGVVAGAVAGAIKSDKSGDLTLEALQMTAQLVRQTKCGAHPKALAPFLDIAFDEGALALEAKKKAGEVLSRKQTKKRRAEEREAIRKGRAEKAKKKADKERLARFGHVDDASDASEDELNEETQLDRDMEEGAGRLDNVKRRKLQSKMLEATFEMYFRVLKNAAGESPARGIPLMTPALVGLGKFTHLISVSFMADLMEVFRRLLKGDALSADQKARCLLTACEITSGHGEALQVDAGEFHRQLYAMLGEPSVGTVGWGGSLGSETSNPNDPEDDDQHSMLSHPVHAASDDALDRGTLRVRALQKFLGAQKQVDQSRVAAFAKRLACAALAAEAGEAVGVLGVARQLLAAYPRARCLLENERVGTGVFDLKSDDPETANGLSAVLWDLALLRNHYHPAVRAAAAEVARMPLAGAVAPALGSHAPSELARLHSTTRGNFRPAIPPPPARKKSKLSPLDRAAARGEASRAAVAEIGKDLASFAAGADFRDTGRNTKARGKETGKTEKKGLHLERRALKRHFTQASLFAAHAALRREAARAARLARRARAFAEERAAAAKQAKKKARSTLSSPDAALKKKALKKKKAKK